MKFILTILSIVIFYHVGFYFGADHGLEAIFIGPFILLGGIFLILLFISGIVEISRGFISDIHKMLRNLNLIK